MIQCCDHTIRCDWYDSVTDPPNPRVLKIEKWKINQKENEKWDENKKETKSTVLILDKEETDIV